MEINLLAPHSNRVIIWGMSCVGKTTFAQLMTDHTYFCFDAMFNWHLIETLGLSIETNLRYIANQCNATPKFVLDGWHLSDKKCELTPVDTTIYVLYDDYESIIKRYRVPVLNVDEHFVMSKKWYNLEFNLPVRFFKSGVETTSFEVCNQ